MEGESRSLKHRGLFLEEMQGSRSIQREAPEIFPLQTPLDARRDSGSLFQSSKRELPWNSSEGVCGKRKMRLVTPKIFKREEKARVRFGLQEIAHFPEIFSDGRLFQAQTETKGRCTVKSGGATPRGESLGKLPKFLFFFPWYPGRRDLKCFNPSVVEVGGFCPDLLGPSFLEASSNDPVQEDLKHLQGRLPGRSSGRFLSPKSQAAQYPWESTRKPFQLLFEILRKHGNPPGFPRGILSLYQGGQVAFPGQKVFRKPKKPSSPEERIPRKKATSRKRSKIFFSKKLANLLRGERKNEYRVRRQDDLFSSVRFLSQKRGRRKGSISRRRKPGCSA
ncbi:hypothetical protein [Aminiphilus sp.]|uniref:hypothetical protein n=1 Tax=Aminiphilus sp. TaxID=1872488 RepID=UPI0026205F79|nr:hypothetical protein [Aminiphilus sp.]